ncbi:unnamed protein product [Closterium sp. NIES-53]
MSPPLFAPQWCDKLEAGKAQGEGGGEAATGEGASVGKAKGGSSIDALLANEVAALKKQVRVERGVRKQVRVGRGSLTGPLFVRQHSRLRSFTLPLSPSHSFSSYPSHSFSSYPSLSLPLVSSPCVPQPRLQSSAQAPRCLCFVALVHPPLRVSSFPFSLPSACPSEPRFMSVESGCKALLFAKMPQHKQPSLRLSQSSFPSLFLPLPLVLSLPLSCPFPPGLTSVFLPPLAPTVRPPLAPTVCPPLAPTVRPPLAPTVRRPLLDIPQPRFALLFVRIREDARKGGKGGKGEKGGKQLEEGEEKEVEGEKEEVGKNEERGKEEEKGEGDKEGKEGDNGWDKGGEKEQEKELEKEVTGGGEKEAEKEERGGEGEKGEAGGEQGRVSPCELAEAVLRHAKATQQSATRWV